MSARDDYVDLIGCPTEAEAGIIEGSLRERGIPARSFTTAAAALGWAVAKTAPYRVQVPRARVEEALRALREIRQSSIDIDWESVDVGAERKGSERPIPAHVRVIIFVIVLVFAAMLLKLMFFGPAPPTP
ncbi:MAG: hypothetical protein ACF8SC_07675 [Phycisphaerales bacterium JB037]